MENKKNELIEELLKIKFSGGKSTTKGEGPADPTRCIGGCGDLCDCCECGCTGCECGCYVCM